MNVADLRGLVADGLCSTVEVKAERNRYASSGTVQPTVEVTLNGCPWARMTDVANRLSDAGATFPRGRVVACQSGGWILRSVLPGDVAVVALTYAPADLFPLPPAPAPVEV